MRLVFNFIVNCFWILLEWLIGWLLRNLFHRMILVAFIMCNESYKPDIKDCLRVVRIIFLACFKTQFQRPIVVRNFVLFSFLLVLKITFSIKWCRFVQPNLKFRMIDMILSKAQFFKKKSPGAFKFYSVPVTLLEGPINKIFRSFSIIYRKNPSINNFSYLKRILPAFSALLPNWLFEFFHSFNS